MHVKNVAQSLDAKGPAHHHDKYLISEVHRVASHYIQPEADVNSPQKPYQGDEH